MAAGYPVAAFRRVNLPAADFDGADRKKA